MKGKKKKPPYRPEPEMVRANDLFKAATKHIWVQWAKGSGNGPQR